MSSTDIELLALDLDGTVIGEDKKLSPTIKEAIAAAQKKGVKVIIATGRMFVSALPYAKQLGLSGPIVTYNGALIKHLKKEQTMGHFPVSLSTARQIIQDAEKMNIHLNLYLDDRLYVSEKNSYSDGYAEFTGVTAHPVGSLLDFMDQPPTKLLAIEEDRNRFEEIFSFFEDKYSQEVFLTESQHHYLEFCSPKATKGRGLAMVADHFDIAQENTMALGDSGNDRTMIQWAGIGGAVQTGIEEVKKEADFIFPEPEKQGVASVIEKYIL